MSEEKVMYTDLKFPNTKKQKEKRHQDQKRRGKAIFHENNFQL
jgi:hypothetical protein